MVCRASAVTTAAVRVDAVEQGLELRDLAFTDRHESLSCNNSRLVGERGQQMHPGAPPSPGHGAPAESCRPARTPSIPARGCPAQPRVPGTCRQIERWQIGRWHIGPLSVIHTLIAVSNSAPSTNASARHSVASLGARYQPARRGQARAPKTRNTHCGRSATHSHTPITEAAPATTATAVIASIPDSEYRTPRASRRSVTHPKYSRRTPQDSGMTQNHRTHPIPGAPPLASLPGRADS